MSSFIMVLCCVCLIQVLSPNNLEMDSETSGIAEWSFSMATPFNPQTVSPFQITTTTTNNTTMTEEEYECPTTDESILALRYVLGNSTKDKAKRFSSRKPARGGMVSSA